MKHHVAEDLTAFADGALPPEQRAEVALHLERCAKCRAERDRIAGTLAALARLPAPPEPSRQFVAGLEARLARERRPALFARFARWRWRLALPAAATAALVAFAVVERGRAARERDVAAHLDLLEDYVVVAGLGDVESAEDAEIVAHLDELVGRAEKGKP